jgi:hypothetical protein
MLVLGCWRRGEGEVQPLQPGKMWTLLPTQDSKAGCPLILAPAVPQAERVCLIDSTMGSRHSAGPFFIFEPPIPISTKVGSLLVGEPIRTLTRSGSWRLTCEGLPTVAVGRLDRRAVPLTNDVDFSCLMTAFQKRDIP